VKSIAWTCVCYVIIFLAQESNAQLKKIEGIIKDQSDSSAMMGVVVHLKYNKTIGTTTDQNGYFTLNDVSSTDVLMIENIGYATLEIPVTNWSTNTSFYLQSIAQDEIIVEGNPYKDQLESTQMSTITLTTKEAKLLPALFGEVDLLKTLQLKPGVQSGGEGSSGLYVRGGGADQNLFLLDDITVYNPSHLFGFFSVFNADAVKNITLYKGGFPARYGGRLSSVVDVHTNRGDSSKYIVNGGIGLISSRLSVEGPLVKRKLWGIVSVRRTYADVFTRLLNKANEGKKEYDPIPDYYFYDANLQLTYTFNDRNSLHLTGYLGRDVFKFKNENSTFGFKWGNTLGGLSWISTIDSSTKLTTTLSVSDYQYQLKNDFSSFNFKLTSGIRDYTINSNLNKVFKKHTFQTGIQVNRFVFNISRLQASSADGSVQFSNGTGLNAIGGGVYANDVFNWHARWIINAGLRWSWFYREQFYQGLEPRLQVNYRLKERVSIKASYSRMYQYIHLASNSGASLPTDIWYPSGNIPGPQRSDQVALGYEFSFLGNKLFFSNEYYYKYLKNVLDFRDGAQLFVNDSLQREFVFGKGESYGTEFYLEKKQGKTTGWIGYTLSWTNRQFAEINRGNWFPARYDRRHDLSVVAVHKLNKRFSFSGTFVYGTGTAVSLPVGRFYIQDVGGVRPSTVPVYTERNAFRLPAYHRMDIGVVYHFKPKWGEADLTLSIYNVYNRRNTYFIYFEEIRDANDIPIKFVAKQVSLFPIIPTLTFNFKW
jgi:TonB dependent receptor/TonB-dependent Receptor Plug Domain/CarboxypepD_reg-like domain